MTRYKGDILDGVPQWGFNQHGDMKRMEFGPYVLVVDVRRRMESELAAKERPVYKHFGRWFCDWCHSPVDGEDGECACRHFLLWIAETEIEQLKAELAAERERCIEENNQLKKALEIVAKMLAAFYPGLDDHHERIIRAAIREAKKGGE